MRRPDAILMIEIGPRDGLKSVAREPLKAGLPREAAYGMSPEAGVPKGFRPAMGAAGDG